MELGSIERELHIDATAEVVYDVISSDEHLQEWWPDHAELGAAEPGTTGTLIFGDPTSPDAKTERFTVLEASPYARFVFRWVIEPGEEAAERNSLLVTFELAPAGEGTLLRFSESGFRERGWEAAVLEKAFQDHTNGWDHFLPRLVAYAAERAVKA